MYNKKGISILAGLLALGLILANSLTVFANEDPPGTGEIVGPELWAVIVIDCGAQATATMRVKRVVDCNVEVQAESMTWSTCPADEAAPLYWQFDTLNLFGINPNPTENTKHPIITSVKNFKKETGVDVYSFDAKLMFWQP
jgi:hypothetical protein